MFSVIVDHAFSVYVVALAMNVDPELDCVGHVFVLGNVNINICFIQLVGFVLLYIIMVYIVNFIVNSMYLYTNTINTYWTNGR